jgi:hypothetical protein
VISSIAEESESLPINCDHPLTAVRLNGAIKQWMTFVKPNYELYVEPQKKNAGKFLWLHISKPPMLTPSRHYGS